MACVFDFAKELMSRGLDTHQNTYDGNMKLQKLLFFANFISLIERGIPLFDEQIRAFSNGCVVEEVRLRYKNDYHGLYAECHTATQSFSQAEIDILDLTQKIFGDLSARELSHLNHSFAFWKHALQSSTDNNGYKDKNLSIISPAAMLAEKERLQVVIDRYRANSAEQTLHELVNGITFYFSPDFNIDDNIMSELEAFSLIAEESSYSVYMDDGRLVIY